MNDTSAYKRFFDPDFCERSCPVCTRARKGQRWAKFLMAIEMTITFGGCPRPIFYSVVPELSLAQ